MYALKSILLFCWICVAPLEGPGPYIIKLMGTWQPCSFNDATHKLDTELSFNEPLQDTFDIAYPNGTKLIKVGVHMANGSEPCFDVRSAYIDGTPFLTETGAGGSETSEGIEINIGEVIYICAWGGSADLYGGTEAWIGNTPIHNGAHHSWMDYIFYWLGTYVPLPV